MFTDPFRYSPAPLVAEAAGRLIHQLQEWSLMPGDTPQKRLEAHFAEGKMLGVLVAETSSDEGTKTEFLYGFSGNVGGRSMIDGFVPPIFDLTAPDGEFKKGEAELNALNRLIASLEDSDELDSARKELSEAIQSRDTETARMKEHMAESKRRRGALRKDCSDSAELELLIKESQFEKAELKRLKLRWEERIASARVSLERLQSEIDILKSRRASMSDKLQKRLFEQYMVMNACGEWSSIRDIFAAEGLVPPGGTGECAAPKLLQYAYTHGMKPLHMGEFWYGKSPEGPVRTHGHFYPSCTSRCGPLLGFMLKGLECRGPEEEATIFGEPAIIYEDEAVIIVSKPSGMPSVPGLDGRTSLLEWLTDISAKPAAQIHTVHRLDMDTSGIMVFAKSAAAAVFLRRQFEDHTVIKCYKARLSPADDASAIPADGKIKLPLSPDYDERPRQKVDITQGKEAVTEFVVQSVNADGTVDILFQPLTGRTHQLRVHSAHTLGLGRPIVGDMLYGGSPADRLCLHAASISFIHPSTLAQISFSTETNSY